MVALSEFYIKEKFPFRAMRQFQLRAEENFFRRVAFTYDATPHEPEALLVSEAYGALKEEVLMQFEYMLDHHIKIEPYFGEGQPYKSSAEMMAKVASTGKISVYLTDTGYGEMDSAPENHPMLEYSDISIDGYRFRFNDLFRAVHDYYCHFSYGHDFSLQGECCAALQHLNLLSEPASRAVFTETVGQICWFYSGAHLLDEDLRLPRKGVLEYRPLPIRPYPAQKAMLLPECLIAQFRRSFVEFA